MLARRALARLPRSSTIFSPVSTSVATAWKGIGNSLKSTIWATGRVWRRSSKVKRWPLRRPRGGRTAVRLYVQLAEKSATSRLRAFCRRVTLDARGE